MWVPYPNKSFLKRSLNKSRLAQRERRLNLTREMVNLKIHLRRRKKVYWIFGKGCFQDLA
jgi:hypothetical protein